MPNGCPDDIMPWTKDPGLDNKHLYGNNWRSRKANETLSVVYKLELVQYGFMCAIMIAHAMHMSYMSNFKCSNHWKQVLNIFLNGIVHCGLCLASSLTSIVLLLW